MKRVKSCYRRGQIVCDRFLTYEERQRCQALVLEAIECGAPIAAIKLPAVRYKDVLDQAMATVPQGTRLFRLPQVTVCGVPIEADASTQQPELVVHAVPLQV